MECFSLLVVTALQDMSTLTAPPLGSTCAVFNWFTLSEPSVRGVEVWPGSVTCRFLIPDLGRFCEGPCKLTAFLDYRRRRKHHDDPVFSQCDSLAWCLLCTAKFDLLVELHLMQLSSISKYIDTKLQLLWQFLFATSLKTIELCDSVEFYHGNMYEMPGAGIDWFLNTRTSKRCCISVFTFISLHYYKASHFPENWRIIYGAVCLHHPNPPSVFIFLFYRMSTLTCSVHTL